MHQLIVVIKKFDNLISSIGKFTKVQKSRLGEIYNGLFSINKICNYAGAFYEFSNKKLTIFAGYYSKINFCVSFCGDNSTKSIIITILEKHKIDYFAEYNAYDNNYWYSILFFPNLNCHINYTEMFNKFFSNNIESEKDLENLIDISCTEISTIITEIQTAIKE